MNNIELLEHYEKLHNNMDQLLAEYIESNGPTRPSKMSVIELLQWSYNRIYAHKTKMTAETN